MKFKFFKSEIKNFDCTLKIIIFNENLSGKVKSKQFGCVFNFLSHLVVSPPHITLMSLFKDISSVTFEFLSYETITLNFFISLNFFFFKIEKFF